MHAAPSSVLHRAVAHPAPFPLTWEITSIDWVRGEGWERGQGPGRAGGERRVAEACARYGGWGSFGCRVWGSLNAGHDRMALGERGAGWARRGV